MSRSLPKFEPDRLRGSVGVPNSGGVNIIFDCVVEVLVRTKLDLTGVPFDALLLVRRRDARDPAYGLGTYATVNYKINFDLAEQYQQEQSAERYWTHGDVVAFESSDLPDYPWDGLAKLADQIAAEFEWGDGDDIVKSLNAFASLDDSLAVEPGHRHTLIDLLGREWEDQDVEFGDVRSPAIRFTIDAIGRVRSAEGSPLKADDLARFLGNENPEIRESALRQLGRTDS